MASVFAVTTLLAKMRDTFAENGVTAPIYFGWREPAKQVNQGPGRANRVVVVPGKGKFMAARNPGRNPRPLHTVLEQLTFYCWGFDPSEPNDELLQYEAARYLLDYTLESIYLNARGTYELSDIEWVDNKTERRFGAECKFTMLLQAMVPDGEWPEADVGPDANVVMEFWSSETTEPL